MRLLNSTLLVLSSINVFSFARFLRLPQKYENGQIKEIRIDREVDMESLNRAKTDAFWLMDWLEQRVIYPHGLDFNSIEF